LTIGSGKKSSKNSAIMFQPLDLKNEIRTLWLGL
jgi:hypothetical protein